MNLIHVEASEMIEAPPKTVYAILSTYDEAHHLAILPQPYFTDVTVEQGGQGAGTVLQVRMTVFGVERIHHLTVTEPEPGRVLVESDPATGVTTSFTVEPVGHDQHSRVTIATDMPAAAGLAGFMERLVSPMVTRHIYKKELRQLGQHVRSK